MQHLALPAWQRHHKELHETILAISVFARSEIQRPEHFQLVLESSASSLRRPRQQLCTAEVAVYVAPEIWQQVDVVGRGFIARCSILEHCKNPNNV